MIHDHAFPTPRPSDPAALGPSSGSGGSPAPEDGVPTLFGDPASQPCQRAEPRPLFHFPTRSSCCDLEAAAESPSAPDPQLARTGPIPPRTGEGTHEVGEGHEPHSLPLKTDLQPFSHALADLLARRHAQDRLHGHTPASDDARDLFAFSKGAGRHLRAMNEHASLHHLEGTRINALKLAAYALALTETCDRRMTSLAAQQAERNRLADQQAKQGTAHD